MGDYFKPWRRKIGLLTLVIACVFMGGWVRSCSRYDTVSIFRGEQMAHWCFSGNGWIWWQMPKTYEDTRPSTLSIHRETSVCPRCEVPYSSAEDRPTMRVMIPYWSLTLPLTIISMWLILSKPSNSSSKKPPEPIPATGAEENKVNIEGNIILL